MTLVYKYRLSSIVPRPPCLSITQLGVDRGQSSGRISVTALELEMTMKLKI